MRMASTLLEANGNGSDNKTTAEYRAVEMKCLHTDNVRMYKIWYNYKTEEYYYSYAINKQQGVRENT